MEIKFSINNLNFTLCAEENHETNVTSASLEVESVSRARIYGNYILAIREQLPFSQLEFFRKLAIEQLIEDLKCGFLRSPREDTKS